MKWVEVVCRVPNEASEALGAVILEWPEVQGLAVEGLWSKVPPHPEYGEWFDETLLEGDEVVVRFYIPEPATAASVMERTIAALHEVSNAGLCVGNAVETLICDVLDEESWAGAWKEDYDPMPIGHRLLIVPDWDADEILKSDVGNRIPIRVEPGMAFGTGTHQTTQLCLEALEDTVKPGDTVLDVGCGTAILSIASAKLGAGRVEAIDIDAVAVRVALENVQKNGMESLVYVREENLLAPPDSALQPTKADDDGNSLTSQGGRVHQYDLILANILRDVVIALLPELVTRLKPGGKLLASGFVKEQRTAVASAFRTHGLHVVSEKTKDDWVLLVGERVS